MFGPYRADNSGIISYVGNKIANPLPNVKAVVQSNSPFESRVQELHDSKIWPAISRINNQINTSITKFFFEKDALFVPLPLTTRMISSPGAIYGKEAIDYTTDTCPITLSWFDQPQEAFLAESAQIYLELALLQKGIDHVFANYHSFRKEAADETHVPEFHHVEYEGKVSQDGNLRVAEGMLQRIFQDLLARNEADLSVFLDEKGLSGIEKMARESIPIVKLEDALDALYRDTGDEQYKEFTLKHFGSWEEIRLTQIVDGIVAVTDMPLFEVPFYHAQIDGSEPPVADNADIIFPGYRETIGSGHRVRNEQELREKAVVFNLPPEDYEPYMQSRRFADYAETSGFGMGWERLLQGLLQMPFITSAMIFPRVDTTLKP